MRAWLRERPAVLVALVLVPLYLAGLGAVPLVEPDEPYYAVPALEMVQAGSYGIPLFHGSAWLDKPPLFYWAVAAAYHVFGPSAFAARLPSALASLALLLAIPGLLRRAGLTVEESRRAALILGTGVEFLVLSRAAVTDAMLTALLGAGMLASAVALLHGRPRWAAAAGGLFGAAALTKGPVGVLVPALALGLAVLALGRRLHRSWTMGIAAGAAFCLVAAPWYVYVAAAYPDLLVRFLSEGNLGRFVSPEHRMFPGFYAAVLVFGLAPWSGGLLPACFAALRKRHESDGARVLRIFLLCWVAAVLAIFQLSASKLATYVLPAFVPAAVLVAMLWSRGSESEVRTAAVLDVLVCSAAAGALIVLSWKGAWNAARIGLVALAGVLLGATLPAVASVSWRCPGRAGLLRAAAAYGIIGLLTFGIAPAMDREWSDAHVVETLRAEGLARRLGGAFGVSQDFGLDFYLGRTIPRWFRADAVAEFLSVRSDAVILARPRDAAFLKARVPSTLVTAGQAGPFVALTPLPPKPQRSQP